MIHKKASRYFILQSWAEYFYSNTHFLNSAIENAGILFSVQHKTVSYSLQEAIYDSRFRRNLNGPFDNAEDAVASILED